jgi:hypothetical protein
MERDKAIALLAQNDLSRLTSEERAEQLEIMKCEAWTSAPRWVTLPAAIREEFESGQEEFCFPVTSTKYDSVLLLWLEDGYRGATNEHLKQKLRSMAIDVSEIIGDVEELTPCPCCGYRTLESRKDYEICGVCWWEDDGQDNHEADIVMGGPNGGISLTQARINFLIEGLCDPIRDDLRKLQQPRQKYSKGRHFVLSDDGTSVSEPSARWRGPK